MLRQEKKPGDGKNNREAKQEKLLEPETIDSHHKFEMDLDIEDFRIEAKDNDRIEVFTTHIVDGYTAEITLSEESSGTRKLFELLPFITKSLIYGTALIIDKS